MGSLMKGFVRGNPWTSPVYVQFANYVEIIDNRIDPVELLDAM